MRWVYASAPLYSSKLSYWQESRDTLSSTLTEQNQANLTRCAEDILLAREHDFPAIIAEMYDPARMDSEFPLVREAHERNDETLERIYIGQRFKNDTERLEKLFEMYVKMTRQQGTSKKSGKRKAQGGK